MRHITDLLGIKRPALRQWVDLGFISPSVKAEGHGSRNGWSREDILNIAVFQALLAHDFTREEAAEVLREDKTYYVGKMFHDGGEVRCVPREREGLQLEDMMGFDTLAVRIVFGDGAAKCLLVTGDLGGGISAFTAVDMAVKYLNLPRQISSMKMVSITQAQQRVVDAL